MEKWKYLKMQALTGGNGDLILDGNTGVNAIIFRACDWSYDCYLGRDSTNRITCFVIDGLVHKLRAASFMSTIRQNFGRGKSLMNHVFKTGQQRK